MCKKIIIIMLLLVCILTGCTSKNTKNMSIEESLSVGLASNKNMYNTNNIGYRYYLPRGFSVMEDRDNIQILKSEGIEYFLNIDLVGYYNKVETVAEKSENVYKYVPISYDNKSGFLEIVKNNDYFLIKMVYNYAIIEAQGNENNLNNIVVNMAYILSSIKYNDIVINNKYGEDVLTFDETVYKIFESGKKQESNQTYAYYLEKYNDYTGKIDIKVEDPDVINN